MKPTDHIRNLYELRELCAADIDSSSLISRAIGWLEQNTDFSTEFMEALVRVGNCTFELDFKDPFFRQFYFGYQHEMIELEFCLATCPPGGIVWDVGASAGLYAVQIARKDDPPSVVMAFEPGKSAGALLQQNVTANGVGEIVQIFDCGLGEVNHESDFSEAQNSAMSGLSDTGRSPINRVYPIAICTADEVWEETGNAPVDLMKIDVEGHECEVLAGAGNLLAGSPHITVLLEICFKNLSHDMKSRLAAQLSRLKVEGWNFHLKTVGSRTTQVADFGEAQFFDDVNGNVFMVRAGSKAESTLHQTLENLGHHDQENLHLKKIVPAALAQIKNYNESQVLERQSKFNELATQLNKLRQRHAKLEERLETLSATLKATEAIAHQKISQKQDMALQLTRKAQELAQSLKKCAALKEELEKYRP